MFRRQVLETIGLQEEALGMFEDYDFALRICRHYKVAFTDIPTYKIRFHPGQISESGPNSSLQKVIEKQDALLRVVKRRAQAEERYFRGKEDLVSRRLCSLHKAVAIPLMTTSDGAKVAREHLAACASYGHRALFLKVISVLPHLFRRIAIKALLEVKAI